MGFWRTVAKELVRRWPATAAVGALLTIHFTVIALSWGSLGALGLVLLISTAFRKWCWRQPLSPALPGLIAGVALIFLVETYLGVSARVFGTFDPTVNPDRQPVGLEGPIIRALGWFYSIRPGQYVELTLSVLGIGFLLHSALHSRRKHRRGATEPGGFIERMLKCLECVGGFALVLESLVFANSVNLKATGLNAFAARYEQVSDKLGSNVSAIGQLRAQVANLEHLDGALAEEPRPRDATKLLDATTALVEALWKLEQAQAEKSEIDEVAYAPDPDPLPQLHPSLPPSARVRDEPTVQERVLSRIGHLTAVQHQAEAADRRADELSAKRTRALSNVAGSIRAALASAQRLIPPEKAKLLEAIAERLAALVAHDGVERATQEILDLAEEVRRQTGAQRQGDNTRRADVGRYRQALQDYMSQRHACVDLAKAVGDFVRHDPDGARLAAKLKAYSQKEGADSPEGGPSPLLARPQWQTPSGANDALTARFTRAISQRIYNQPSPPIAVLEGYGETLKTAYRATGGAAGSPGFGLLKSWVEDACGSGEPPEAMIAQLRKRARQKSL